MAMGTARGQHTYFAQVVTANNHEVLLFGVAQELAQESKREGQSFNEMYYTGFCPFWQGVIVLIFAVAA